jgi:hypothetical protein
MHDGDFPSRLGVTCMEEGVKGVYEVPIFIQKILVSNICYLILIQGYLQG